MEFGIQNNRLGKGVMTTVVIVAALVGPMSLPAQEHGGAVEIEITMDEQFYQVEGQRENERLVIEAGHPIRIEFYNDGFEVHEVMFGRGGIVEDDEHGEEDDDHEEADEHAEDEHGNHGYVENLFDGVMFEIIGETDGSEFEIMGSNLMEIKLESLGWVTLVFTLPESKVGTWEMGCFLKDHYEKGMRTELVVVAD